jgi:hypothetical protein
MASYARGRDVGATKREDELNPRDKKTEKTNYSHVTASDPADK